MAKKTQEELKAEVTSIKEELKVAKIEKRDFEKSHKLPKDTDHSGNEKLGKKWSKLNAMVEKKEKALEAARAALTEAKPQKTARVTTYDYPLNEDGKEMTAGEKKKFRAAARAAKKKAEKEAANPKSEKAPTSKKSDKADKKSKKKASKKAEAASEEETPEED